MQDDKKEHFNDTHKSFIIRGKYRKEPIKHNLQSASNNIDKII